VKRRAVGPIVLVALLAATPARAATPLPPVPPPPDLTTLIPFAETPLDKPAVGVGDLALPEGPTDLPPFPPATVVAPWGAKPTAALPEPTPLACVGAFFGVASAALECGRARVAKAEYEDAAKALEQAARSGAERDLVLEARYWLGETYWQLGRVEPADRLFRQVVQTAPKANSFGLWATHSSGWTALRLGDATRARDTFAQLLAGAVPAAMEPWARHGQALASYALGHHDEAVAAWEALRSKGVPASLARDVGFWLGEALGRVGRYDRAATELERFVTGGPHALADAGWLRLGWWSLAARRTKQSADAFRTYLTPSSPSAAPRIGTERDWAEAGLALALLASDSNAARAAARGLEARRSPLLEPLFLRFARALVDAKKGAEAQAILQELLGANLTPAVRAWVLLLNGEASRAQGNLDDARTQYDLARRTDPGSATAWFAGLRQAQANLELREFAQAARDLAELVATAPSGEARAAVLLLQGEAAYHAGNYAAAGAAFRRAAIEFPGHPQVGAARLGVAWTALRQERDDEARREFLEFARLLPQDPQAPDALLLASELALKVPTGLSEAKALLDRIIKDYPTRPRTEFARLNRALVLLRTGDVRTAQAELRDWIGRAPFPPLLGRAHAALGVALLAARVPSEAEKAFAQAQREGLGALATLGLATVQLAQGKLDVAKGLFEDARDKGTSAIARAAEYGLAAVAFQSGAHKDFKRPALAELDAAPKGRGAPRLLYVLSRLAVEEKDWTSALEFAKRLADEFPNDEAADDAFESVGAGATQAAVWPVAYAAYGELRQRYPKSPFAEAASLTLAQAQLETGRADAARQELEKAVASAPADAKLGRAWLLLGRARGATGDRPGALEAYARAAKDGRGPEWDKTAVFDYARLLSEDKRWSDARAILGEFLRRAGGPDAADAAYAIGETYAGEGDSSAAAEYFMTAAYVAPESAAGRRALLGAAASFVALKQPDSAAVVYRKLLDQPQVPAELADAARRGLKEIGR
jgi:TolA-binding protein